MFGGLAVKGTPEKPKQERKADSGVGATTANSAFSFLNNASSTPQISEQNASSGFSFLKPGKSENETSDEVAPQAPVATTAFDFLMSTSSTPAVAPISRAPQDEVTNAEVNRSSFSFLQHSTVSEVPPLASEIVGIQNTTLISPGFSFLPGHGGGDTVSSLSRDSPAPSETGISISSVPIPAPSEITLSTSCSSTAGPAGSGVVFGGGALAAAKPIKKRNRTAKIGVAAAACAPPSLNVARATVPSPCNPTITSSSENDGIGNTLDAASEASRRAEEFIKQKLKQQSAVASVVVSSTDPVQIPSKTTYTHVVSNPFALVEEAQSLDEDDEMVQKAIAAAEEAQQQMARQRSLSDRMGLSKLFGSRSSPQLSSNQGELGSIPSASVATVLASSSNKPSAQRQVEVVTNYTATSTSSRDQFQDDHEDLKKGVIKYQPQKQQHHQDEDDDAMPGPTSINGEPPNLSSEPPKSFGSLAIPNPSPSKVTSFHNKMSPKSPLSTYVQDDPILNEISSTEVFKKMLKDFRNEVGSAMSELTRLRQQRSGLLEERFLTSAKERLATQQKIQAEAQQLAAAEEEDFELADKMGGLIEAHEREKVEFASISENISRALRQLDLQKKRCVEKVTLCFTELQTRLKDFSKEQELNDTKGDSETMNKFLVVSRQLSIENERLQHDWKHLERDAELVGEERKELESAISEQSGEFERMRDEAKAKLCKVDEEIEELRKQLLAKQKEAAALRTEAAGHEEMILKVRVKFARQLTRVQKKEATIKDNQEEWMLEKNAFELHKQDHEARVQAHSEALLARDKLLEQLSKEAEMAGKFKEIVAKELGFGNMPSERDELDHELAQMQANVVKCEAAVNEAKNHLKVSKAVLVCFEEEVKTLETRIPVLQELKNTAAARRDFKGAGIASKEIKDATSRLKEINDDLIDGARKKVVSAEEDLEVVKKELEEQRKIAQDQERETSIATMRRLADKIEDLMAIKATFCNDGDEHSVQSVGAYVLDGQILSLKTEGQTFGEKYGLWDELLSKIGAQTLTAEPSAEQLDIKSSTNDSTEEAVSKTQDDANAENEKSEAAATDPVMDDAAQSEKLQMFRELTKRLKEVESSLEEAVEKECYEEAAELDERLQMLLSETAALGLTEEEMAAALADGDELIEEAGISAERTVEEEKLDTKDEETLDSESSVDPEAKIKSKLNSDDVEEETVSKLNSNTVEEETEPTQVEDSISADNVAASNGHATENGVLEKEHVAPVSETADAEDNDKFYDTTVEQTDAT